VREDARGRGCYRALVRARWDEAVRRGTPAVTVTANDKSGPVLHKLGFEKVLELRRLEDVLSVA
jgi:GNAT superfamily N-acetyltransferase